jgi:hypothetical protein
MRPIFLKIVPVALLWILTASTAWPAMHLALIGGEPERVLACIPADSGKTMHLEFINSIYQAKVRESFELHPTEGLILISVESPSPGVFEYYGMMTDGSGKAALRRPVGAIRLRSHDYRNHRLIVGAQEIPLRPFIENGRPLMIRVMTGNGCLP